MSLFCYCTTTFCEYKILIFFNCKQCTDDQEWVERAKADAIKSCRDALIRDSDPDEALSADLCDCNKQDCDDGI